MWKFGTGANKYFCYRLFQKQFQHYLVHFALSDIKTRYYNKIQIDDSDGIYKTILCVWTCHTAQKVLKMKSINLNLNLKSLWFYNLIEL